MEKLIQFIAYRYAMAEHYGSVENMLNQAFGALELYHHMNPDKYDECEKLWNDVWHPKFLALIYAPITEPSKRDTEWRSKPGNPFI